MDKNDLWQLVMATMRLRLTAYSLAGLPERAAPPSGPLDPVRQRLHDRGTELTSFYDQIAAQVGRGPGAQWRRAAVTQASFPALTPVELADPAAGNGQADRTDPDPVVPGVTVAAEQDVAIAE